MLQNSQAFSSFSTNNLEKTREFYGKTLGLTVKDNPMELVELHLEGNNPIMIYPKEDHQPATFTILNFPVDNIDKTVDELVSKGVKMEQYEGFGQDQKGIARGEGPLIAWFKDPAGNILSIIQDS